MNKIIFIILVLIISLNLFADTSFIILPDGKMVAVSNYSLRYDKTIDYAEFVSPELFETKAGNFKAYKVFYDEKNNLKKLLLFETQDIKISSNNLKIDEIDFYENGEAKSIHLIEPQILKISIGKILVINTIELYQNGIIQSVNLNDIQTIASPAGNIDVKNYINFNDNGTIQLTELNSTVKTKSSIGTITLKEYIGFFSNGNIKEGKIADDLIHLNKSNAKGSFSNVLISFFSNEQIKSIASEFNESFTIKTNFGTLKVKSINFYKSGEISKIQLDEPHIIKTQFGPYEFQQNENIILYKNGFIKELFCQKEFKLKTPVGKFGTDKATFYPNGKIQSIDWSEYQYIETPVGNFECNNVSFFNNGKIKEVYFYPTMESPIIDTGKGGMLLNKAEFFESGKIKYANIVNQTSTVKSLYGKIDIWTEISFYENGNFKTICQASCLFVKHHFNREVQLIKK